MIVIRNSNALDELSKLLQRLGVLANTSENPDDRQALYEIIERFNKIEYKELLDLKQKDILGNHDPKLPADELFVPHLQCYYKYVGMQRSSIDKPLLSQFLKLHNKTVDEFTKYETTKPFLKPIKKTIT